MRLALVVLAISFTSPAHAEEDKGHFHVLTPALTKRLQRGKSARFRNNLETVAIYHHAEGHTGGTGYLVTTRDEDGTALMLTNHHVALFEDDKVRNDTFLFHPRGDTTKPLAAKVITVVASSAGEEDDYALVRVTLPPELAGIEPVKPSKRVTFQAGELVYNPSFPRLVEGEVRTPKRLQVGHANGTAFDRLESFYLPNQRGSSGSPVFAKDNDELVGMMNAGAGDTVALVRPLGRIIDSLRKKRDTILNAGDRARVDELLVRWSSPVDPAK